MQAYEYVQRMRADMRGTNLLGALSWVYQQPMQRSYPRQVFIITDGSIRNVAKVLELVRRNTCAGRYEALELICLFKTWKSSVLNRTERFQEDVINTHDGYLLKQRVSKYLSYGCHVISHEITEGDREAERNGVR